MKNHNHVVNKDKVHEAFIQEPHEHDKEVPLDGPTHGWQVVLVFKHQSAMFINKASEQECIDLIDSFGFIKV